MRDPNFSELQFQQAVNTALIQQALRAHGVWSLAHVPSLIAEFELGWDAAFHFSWLPHLPSPDDEGCNFFLQYKLSGELTSRGALEWSSWNSMYYRFRIPHSTRSPAGAFINDCHQWGCLKTLAERGYRTLYVTNATLHKADLQSQLQAETLLDNVAALDVRGVAAQHKHVSFTPPSTHVFLHSEKEESGKLTLSRALALVSEAEQLPLSTSLQHVVAVLQELPSSDAAWSYDLARLSDQKGIDGLRAVRYWVQYAHLTALVWKHVGANLLWLPKGGA